MTLGPSTILGFKCYDCDHSAAKFTKPTDDNPLMCPECGSSNFVATQVRTPMVNGKVQIASMFDGTWAESVKELE